MAQTEVRRFQLHRDVDMTGVSGTGVVAEGVLWPDGTASVLWNGEHGSIVFWPRGMDSIDHVHGHNGATRIVWIDEGAESTTLHTCPTCEATRRVPRFRRHNPPMTSIGCMDEWHPLELSLR
jgi:hypothetical protein